jgi:hypothetical protein
MSETWRNLIGGALALVGTLGTLAAHQLLFSPPPPTSREYALTGLVVANYTWGAAAVLFAVGFGVGFGLRLNPLAAGAGFTAVEALATFHEIRRYPTSHNLLPFDVISWMVMASPLVLGAFLGKLWRERLLARRAGSLYVA